MQQNRTVSIYVVGAIIAPSKTDGALWDDPVRDAGGSSSHVPAWVTDSLVDLVNQGTQLEDITKLPGGDNIEQFEKWLVDSGLNGLIDLVAKPDAYGSVDLVVNDVATGHVALPKVDNSFTPRWFQGWTGVKWATSPSLKLTLVDSDPISDDPIGTVLISTSDLEGALADGKTHYVKVADQSDRQLLYVAITVTPEGWTYTPGGP